MYIPTDVNECSTSNGGCEQICENSNGSFTCYCYDGYMLNKDLQTCGGKYITKNQKAFLYVSNFILSLLILITISSFMSSLLSLITYIVI